MKNLTNAITGIIILTVLFLPLGLSFGPDTGQESFVRDIEKRRMAEWPRIHQWQTLLSADTYQRISLALRDRLPGRSRIIISKNQLAYFLLDECRFGEVDRGKAGWLFVRSGYYRPWETPEKVNRIISLVEYFMAQRDDQEPIWQLFVGPDKDVIYPEKLGARFAALATWSGRRREVLRNFCEDNLSGVLNSLWDEYQSTRRSTMEPIFFKYDTHHTPRGMLVLARAIVEKFHPGIWNPAEVRPLKKTLKPSDLAPLAGLGVAKEPEQRYGLERQGVELVSQEVAPDKDWQKPGHYISRSATRPMILGRTLILHDSLLAEARPLLRQFFQDVEFMHYDDFIRQHTAAEKRRQYDRIILETAERQTTYVWGRLFEMLNARPAWNIPLADLLVKDEGRNATIKLTSEGLHLGSSAWDLKVFLPGKALPSGNTYLLKIEMDANTKTGCQLFYRDSPAQDYLPDKMHFREIQPGRNYLTFPVVDRQLASGLRFDPATDPGIFLIRSLTVCQVAPGVGTAAAAGLQEQGMGNGIALWMKNTLVKNQSGQTAHHEMLVGNPQVRMSQTPEGLRLLVNGNDPMLFLPGLDDGDQQPLVVGLELESEQSTLCQLYFRHSPDEAFTEQKAITRNIHPGLNRLRFKLPLDTLFNGLRLDPACQSGQYLIRRLYVESVAGPGKAHHRTRVDLIYPYDPIYRLQFGEKDKLVQGSGLKFKASPDGVALEVVGRDPMLFYPQSDITADLPAILSLALTSPRETECQVFYCDAPGQNYDEARSIRARVHPGLNQMNFVLPAGCIRYGMRFDPADLPGEYFCWEFDLGFINRDFNAAGVEHNRAWFESLPARRQQEVFTRQTSQTLQAWRAGEMDIQTTGNATRILLPAKPVSASGRCLLQVSINAPAAGQARLYYLNTGQKEYNEMQSQPQRVRPGLNRMVFYLEQTELQQALRLDVENSSGAVAVEWAKLRELYGSER